MLKLGAFSCVGAAVVPGMGASAAADDPSAAIIEQAPIVVDINRRY